LSQLQAPAIIEYLTRIGAPQLDPLVVSLAQGATLAVGGGNAGMSPKSNPSYQDIDLYLLIPSTALTDQQASQLRAVLNRRMTQEILAQRDGCTIPGVDATVDGALRQLDVGKVGTTYKGVIWPVPGLCNHCNKFFNDGKFVTINGRIVYEAHAGL
jgi:hypothetical protein